jgi:TolA-binding protein
MKRISTAASTAGAQVAAAARASRTAAHQPSSRTVRRLLLVLGALLLLAPLPALAASEEELFTEAESYYRAGNYLLALDTYGELVRSYPLSDRVPDAQYRRGVSLFRLGRFREALGVFAEIERRYRATRFFDYIYFWRGVAHYRLEEPAKAVEALARFIEAVEDRELSPQAYLYKGQAEIALEDFRAASKDLQTLVDRYPESQSGRYGLVLLLYSYLREGRYPEIEELAAATDPGALPEKRRSLFTLYTAEAYWREGRTAEAEELYTGLLESGDEVAAAVAYRRLFMAAAQRSELSRMEALIRQAESRFAGSPQVLADLWVQAGVESFQQDKLDLAEYFLGKAWNLPDKEEMSETVPLYLAEIHLRRGEALQASAVLEEYIAANPRSAELTLLKLADVRLQQAAYPEAEQIYSRYLAEHPDSSLSTDAGYLLAYSHFRQGDLEEALRLASARLEETTDASLRADLYKLVIVVHKRRGETAQAAARLREYCDLYPDDIKARISLLKQLFVLKDYGAIVSETNRLRQEFPALEARDLNAYLLSNYLRGLAEIGRKRYQSAQEALNALSREKTEQAGLATIWPYTLYYQAWAAYRLARYTEARQKVVRLLEAEPSHPLFPQALFLAGWSSYSLGDYEASAQYFSRLAKMNKPESDKAAFLQARSLVNLGELDEAAVLFKAHYSGRPASQFADDALFEYAGILAEKGRSAEAAAAYGELAARYPSSSLAGEALYKRGEVFSAAGRYQDARDAFYEYRTRYPRGPLVDASLYWGGMASYELGERFGAVLHWERLLENFPVSPFRPDALRRTAEVYAERGDYSRAIELYTTLADEYPEEARVYNAAQRIDELRYLQQGLSDREAVLSSIIGREGGAETAKGREAMIELARLYIYEGSRRMELAFQMLQKVVDKGETVTAAQAQFLIGEYYYRKADPVQAAREFLKAGYLDPNDPDQMAASIYRAAEMMHLAGKTADVRELVGRLEQHFPDSEWTAEARKLLEGG